jgi:Ca2+-binding EF-hand superfamily protein
MQILAPELTKSDISRLFAIVDIDNNNQISYTEFLAATLDPREVDIEELSKAFKLLDEDGNGYITKDEMRSVLDRQYSFSQEQGRRPVKRSSKFFTRKSFSLGSSKNDSGIEHHLEKKNSGLMINPNLISEIEDDDAGNKIDTKLRDVFDQADVNRDGVISYQEFLFAMTGLDYYLNGTRSYKTSTDFDVDDSYIHRNNSEVSSPQIEMEPAAKRNLISVHNESSNYFILLLQKITFYHVCKYRK